MIKLHENNLPQIKATVAAYGICYVHGCGNMYVTETESNFRKDFSNPDSEASTYRVKFVKGDTLPTSIEQLKELLLDAKNQEVLNEREIKEISSIRTIVVPVVPANEIKETDEDIPTKAEMSEWEQNLIEREKALEEKEKAFWLTPKSEKDKTEESNLDIKSNETKTDSKVKK